MADELDTQAAHRFFAADAFNDCWQLIDKAERDADDDEAMLRLAEVSMWHWQKFEGHTQENLSIGYWLLARVYTIAAQIDRAVQHAQKCVTVTEAAALNSFCAGYAFEALARAKKAAGADADWPAALAQGYAAADEISEKESRDQLISDLTTIGPRS